MLFKENKKVIDEDMQFFEENNQMYVLFTGGKLKGLLLWFEIEVSENGDLDLQYNAIENKNKLIKNEDLVSMKLRNNVLRMIQEVKNEMEKDETET